MELKYLLNESEGLLTPGVSNKLINKNGTLASGKNNSAKEFIIDNEDKIGQDLQAILTHPEKNLENIGSSDVLKELKKTHSKQDIRLILAAIYNILSYYKESEIGDVIGKYITSEKYVDKDKAITFLKGRTDKIKSTFEKEIRKLNLEDPIQSGPEEETPKAGTFGADTQKEEQPITKSEDKEKEIPSKEQVETPKPDPLPTTSLSGTKSHLDLISRIPETTFTVDKIHPELVDIYNSKIKKIDDTIKLLQAAKEKLSVKNESVIIEAINMEDAQEVDRFLSAYLNAKKDLENEFAKYGIQLSIKRESIGKSHIVINPQNYDRQKTIEIKKNAIRFLSKVSNIERGLLSKELPNFLERMKMEVKKTGEELSKTTAGKIGANVFNKAKEIGKNIKSTVNIALVDNDIKAIQNKGYYTPEESESIKGLETLKKENPQEYANKADAINKNVFTRLSNPSIKTTIAAIVEKEKTGVSPETTAFRKEISTMINTNKINEIRLKEIIQKIKGTAQATPVQKETPVKEPTEPPQQELEFGK